MASVDVHQWHGDVGRGERLGCQMRHHNAVFSSAEEDDRSLKLSGNLPQQEHGLRLEFVQMVQLVVLRHSCAKVRGESLTSQFSVAVPRPLVKIVQGHLQHAFCNGHTRGFLNSFGVFLKKKPSQQERSSRGDNAPRYGFGKVSDTGFFRSGHGRQGQERNEDKVIRRHEIITQGFDEMPQVVESMQRVIWSLSMASPFQQFAVQLDVLPSNFVA